MTGESVIYGVVMAAIGGLCLLLTVVTLPGNWLMLLAAGIAQVWSTRDGGAGAYSGWTLGALAVLAVLGEVAETAMGAAGAKAGGARSRGAWGAVLGSLAGALVGTVVLAFVPIVGTLAGALIGAGLGAFVGELTYGDRRAGQLLAPAAGAAAGRVAGVIAKAAIGAVMWTVLVVGALWA